MDVKAGMNLLVMNVIVHLEDVNEMLWRREDPVKDRCSVDDKGCDSLDRGQ